MNVLRLLSGDERCILSVHLYLEDKSATSMHPLPTSPKQIESADGENETVELRKRTLPKGLLTHDGGLSGARRWVLSLALASSKGRGRFRKLCVRRSTLAARRHANRVCSPHRGASPFALHITCLIDDHVLYYAWLGI